MGNLNTIVIGLIFQDLIGGINLCIPTGISIILGLLFLFGGEFQELLCDLYPINLSLHRRSETLYSYCELRNWEATKMGSWSHWTHC